jgi:hypothetical protein
MTSDLISKSVLVLCDYDALYAAIELKLSIIPEAKVTRRRTNQAGRPKGSFPAENFDLIIVATASPKSDPLSMLSKTSLLDRVGKSPLLIISEQSTRSESDEDITYLNFPFDMDELTRTVAQIFSRRNLNSVPLQGRSQA